MVMVLVLNLLRWWYTDGWRARARLVADRLDGTIDYFSIDLLLKTLFSPFRQISAGRVDGPLGVQFRALIDKLFSRIIGAFIRLIILVIGGIIIGLQVLLSLIILLGWMIVPLFPVIGLILTLIGRTF
jgi:hypothetical protein